MVTRLKVIVHGSRGSLSRFSEISGAKIPGEKCGRKFQISLSRREIDQFTIASPTVHEER